MPAVDSFLFEYCFFAENNFSPKFGEKGFIEMLSEYI